LVLSNISDLLSIATFFCSLLVPPPPEDCDCWGITHAFCSSSHVPPNLVTICVFCVMILDTHLLTSGFLLLPLSLSTLLPQGSKLNNNPSLTVGLSL